MKLPCYLVRDLLPLYKDEVCEPETAADVQEHLDGCPDCRHLWETMQDTAPLEGEVAQVREQEQAAALRRVRRTQRKKRALAVLAVVLATLCAVFLGLTALYAYANDTCPDYEAGTILDAWYDERDGQGNSPFTGEGLYVTLSDEAAGALASSKLVETEEGTAVVFTVNQTLWQQWLNSLQKNPQNPENTRTAICTAGGYGRSVVESLCAAY